MSVTETNINNFYDYINNGLIDEVKLLIDKYKNIDFDIVNSTRLTETYDDTIYRENSDTPLSWAINTDNYRIAILLINNGANVRKATFGQDSALYYIIFKEYANNYGTINNQRDIIELVQLLIDKGENVDYQSNIYEYYGLLYEYSSLMLVCKYLNIDIVELLLKAGADPNLINKVNNNNTALIYATEHINDTDGAFAYEAYQVTQLLLEYDANPNLRDNIGETALHIIIKNTGNGDELIEDTIILLLEYGADPYLYNNSGYNVITDPNIDPAIQSFISDYVDKHKSKKFLALSKGLNLGPLSYLRELQNIFSVRDYVDYDPISEKRETLQKIEETKMKERRKKKTKKKKRKQKKEKKKKKLY